MCGTGGNRMGDRCDSEEYKYSESGWNLNNIPNLKVQTIMAKINIIERSFEGPQAINTCTSLHLSVC